MRRAGGAATVGFAALVIFQGALAAGALLGDAAWGGADADLTTGQRVGSAISVLVYLAAIIIVRGRAAGRTAWPQTRRWLAGSEVRRPIGVRDLAGEAVDDHGAGVAAHGHLTLGRLIRPAVVGEVHDGRAIVGG